MVERFASAEPYATFTLRRDPAFQTARIAADPGT
jgi:hypothetical protein